MFVELLLLLNCVGYLPQGILLVRRSSWRFSSHRAADCFGNTKRRLTDKLARKASHRWIGRLLRNVLIISQGEDQAGVLLHVEQQVVQVEHQQLDALLADREVWMNIIANVDIIRTL